MRFRTTTCMRKHTAVAIALAAGVLMPGLLTPTHAATAVENDIAKIIAAAGGHATVTASPVTGTVAFISIEPGYEIPTTGDTPEVRAVRFVKTYLAAFGIAGGKELKILGTRVDELGLDEVRLAQLRSTLLVTGSYITVHLLDAAVISVSARTIGPSAGLVLEPTQSAAQATAVVQSLIAKQFQVTDATLSKPVLEILPLALVQGVPRPPRLAWFVEARRNDLRQWVWVDALTKQVLLSLSQRPDALARSVFDGANSAVWPTAPTRSEGQEPVGVFDVDLAYDYSGDFYDFFHSRMLRDGLDGLGGPLRAVVRHCSPGGPCPNNDAYWNGSEAVLGDAMAVADDVVAHELAHGLIEKSTGLLYYGQAGALNESFADLFAELIDQANGRGDDSSGQRWRIGEDLGSGPLRNMSDPSAFSQPAWTGDENYACDGSDGAGVHANGAVLSRAFVLMADGGTFRDQTVSGIGTEKVGKIAYRALTGYLTGDTRNAADFLAADLALRQACGELAFVGLTTSDDCLEVGKALDAVELTGPTCRAVAAVPMCSAGLGPVDAFADDFENTTTTRWVTKATVGSNAWTGGGGTPAILAKDFPYGGVRGLRARSIAAITDSYVETKNQTLVPAGGQLRFMHAFEVEDGVEGGVVEYSVDGGDWQDAGPLFAAGTDYATEPLLAGSDNPLAGRRAFTGSSRGYVASQYDLSSLAGHNVRVRFRFASDSTIARDAWYIDDLRIYGCDVAGTFQIDPGAVTVAETTAKVTLKVTRTGGVAGGVVVAYRTNDGAGTATANADYKSVAGTLTFAAGVMSQSFVVKILDDTLDDEAETFDVDLSIVPGDVDGELGVPSTATITITDNDVAGTIKLKKTAITVAEATKTVAVPLARSGGVASGATVQYRLEPVTAQPGLDYVASGGTVTFGLNVTAANATITLLPDKFAEGTETFRLVLENPGGGALLAEPTSAVISITDDDVGGVVQFAKAAYSGWEGSGGVTVTVARSGGTAEGVMVDFATSDGTALDGSDYTAVGGTLTFGPSETSKTITIPVLPDMLSEGSETFTVTLGNPRGGGTIGANASTVVTIADDAGVFNFETAAYTVAESAASASLRVMRDGSSAGVVTVQYEVTDGSALAGKDYIAPTPNPGTLTFASGVTSQTITIKIKEDTLTQGDHTFLVRLLNGIGGRPGTSDTAAVVIKDNESTSPGSVGIDASSYAFDETDGVGTIPVLRVDGLAGRVTVDYHTEDYVGTAGVDYTAVSGTLTFENGVDKQYIHIPIIADSVPTGGKQVWVYLTNFSPGVTTFGDHTRLVIFDDENSVELISPWIRNYEGNCANVMIVRGGDVSSAVTVDYATSDGTPIPDFAAATAGLDYTPMKGSITIPAGAYNASFCIELKNDGLGEGYELLHLSVTNPRGGGFQLGRSSEGDMVIIDAEAAGSLYIESPSYTAAEGSTFTVNVRRKRGTGAGVTVQYEVQGGTAESGADFKATSGTLTFGSGVLLQTFNVQIYNDTLVEGAEAATIVLKNPSNGVSFDLDGPSVAALHIQDTDAPSVQLNAPTYQVPETVGTTNITVTRTSKSGVATVDFSGVAGSGWDSDDFTEVHGTLTFAAGQDSLTRQIPIAADAQSTGPRTVNIALSNPSAGLVLGYPATAVLTILDDEVPPTVQFAVGAFSRLEGATLVNVTVSRSDGTAGGATVDYATSGGTATAGADYLETAGTLTFASGESSKTFAVPIVDDGIAEPSESVILSLSNPGGGLTLGQQTTASIWIVDND